ncbi:MAG: hypothetical protein KAS23_02835 [Anaerohalosphaera sp.]|nr:hypothetical protein [Anaerohalosphaera sp.]
MSNKSNSDHAMFLLVVGLLAWVIPGAGHFLIKERKRAAVIFVTIVGTFLVGLHVGSVAVINSKGAGLWYIAQMMVSPGVAVIANITRQGEYLAYGKCSDIGQIYTSIAGLLNMLCIVSAVYMGHSGRGELIGDEEDDK